MNIYWKSIIGHKENVKKLRNMLAAGRLPHAILLSGPKGVGKRMVAEALAASILCKGEDACGNCPSCRALSSSAHPDYFVVEAEGKGKSAPTIKIEQIREMQAEVAHFSILSKCRVVLIDDADLMNEAAENSLLKTLEEPAGQVTFLLVTSAESSLLDTIISRCMPMRFGPLPMGHLTELLKKRGIPEDEAAELAALSDGSAGRAIELHENGGMELRDDAVAFLKGLDSMDMEAVWSKSKLMGDMTREKLSEWFMYLNMLLRDMLVLYGDGGSMLLYHQDIREDMSSMLAYFPEHRIFLVLELVRKMQQRLQVNVNLQLLMEGFFIRMKDI